MILRISQKLFYINKKNSGSYNEYPNQQCTNPNRIINVLLHIQTRGTNKRREQNQYSRQKENTISNMFLKSAFFFFFELVPQKLLVSNKCNISFLLATFKKRKYQLAHYNTDLFLKKKHYDFCQTQMTNSSTVEIQVGEHRYNCISTNNLKIKIAQKATITYKSHCTQK